MNALLVDDGWTREIKIKAPYPRIASLRKPPDANILTAIGESPWAFFELKGFYDKVAIYELHARTRLTATKLRRRDNTKEQP